MMTTELIDGRKVVEDFFTEGRDLQSVRLFIAEAMADSMDAAQERINKVGHGRARLCFHLAQTVNDRSFAQSIIASPQAINLQRADHAFENLSARDDDFGSLRADARN